MLPDMSVGKRGELLIINAGKNSENIYKQIKQLL